MESPNPKREYFKSVIKKADSLLKSSGPDSAISYLTSEHDTSGRDPYIASVLIRFLADNKNYDKALKLCDDTLSAKPDDPVILCNKGMILINTGSGKEALEIADLTVKKFPDDKFVNDFAVSAYVTFGQTAKAIEQSTAFLKKELEADDRRFAYKAAYKAYDANGQTSKKVDLAEDYLEKFPNEKRGFVNLINFCIEDGQIDKALKTAEQYKVAYPKLDEPYELLLDIYKAANDKKGVINAAELLRDTFPQKARPYGYVVTAYLDDGQTSIAVSEAKNYRKKFPEQKHANGLVVLCCLHDKQPKEAAKYAEIYLHKFPDEMHAHNLLIKSYNAAGWLFKAVEAAEDYAGKFPKHDQAQGMLVATYLLASRYNEAENHLENIKETNKDYYLKYKGMISIAKGDFKNGIDTFYTLLSNKLEPYAVKTLRSLADNGIGSVSRFNNFVESLHSDGLLSESQKNGLLINDPLKVRKPNPEKFISESFLSEIDYREYEKDPETYMKSSTTLHGKVYITPVDGKAARVSGMKFNQGEEPEKLGTGKGKGKGEE